MSLWDTIGGTAALIFGRIAGGDEKELTVDGDGHLQVDVLSTTGTTDVNVTDRAARDLGKVDVAGIDAVGGAAGQKAKAASFPVTRPSDDEMLALVGAIDETAPAGDTADSGLNGRLQRVAQRLTSLMGLVGEVQASPTENTVLDRLKDLLTGIVLAAGTNIIGKTQPFAAVAELGITELIGVDEQVDQNEYSASVGVALGGTYSGEILSFLLISTEDGSGAVQEPEGWLYILDADPTTAAGDAALAAAEWPTVLGRVQVESADWQSDANGGSAYLVDTPVAFHALANLYFVFQLTSATSFNDVAGDDEQLELNAWFRRDS